MPCYAMPMLCHAADTRPPQLDDGKAGPQSEHGERPATNRHEHEQMSTSTSTSNTHERRVGHLQRRNEGEIASQQGNGPKTSARQPNKSRIGGGQASRANSRAISGQFSRTRNGLSRRPT